MGTLFTRQRECRSWFIFLCCSYDDWTIFWQLRNLKKVTCNLPGFSSPKKDFWVVLLQWLHQIFLDDVFWMPNKSLALCIEGFWLSSLASEKSHVDPATQLHPVSKTMFFVSGCDFSSTKLNRLKQKKLNDTFLIQFPKKHRFRILIEPFWIAIPKRPFPGRKIMEKST